MHVSFHQLSDDVDVLVPCPGRWLLNINKTDDVLVVEKLQKFDLTHNSLGVDQIFECFRYFFNGYFNLCFMVIRAANYTVGTMPDLFDALVFVLDEETGT